MTDNDGAPSINVRHFGSADLHVDIAVRNGVPEDEVRPVIETMKRNQPCQALRPTATTPLLRGF